MDLKYSDMEGNSVDPSALTMGKDFKAEVTIQNMGGRYYNIDEMALSQIFPSGWEILNTRLSGVGDLSKDSPSKYRNYRDDRVYTFFDIRGTGNYKYTVLLNASYAGRFYLPPVSAEAMYDNEVQANSAGYWVNVLQN
jgi:uncharacterized protein YfaS (alpha-2-macroglobulin family)